MPGGYAGKGEAELLRENEQVFLFQQEVNVTGHASIAVQLERRWGSYPWGISFQVYFTDGNGNPADPGAFEMDIQASDIDQDNRYCGIGTVSEVDLNPSFTAFNDTTRYVKYARVLLRTLTNPVFTTVLLTR